MSLVPLAEPLHDPDPGVRFPLVLRGAGHQPARTVLGLVFALSGYVFVTQIVSTVVLGLGYLARGSSGGFAAYSKRAMAYHLPEGMIAGHLGLAGMVLLALALVVLWHRRPRAWATSVQPGVRWRYLLACTLVATAVLNAVAWWQRGGAPFTWAPTSHLVWWLLLIVVTSPLQAAGEEYLFRGYLTQAFGALTRSSWLAVASSALLFALFHGTQNVWLFADRLAFGLVAGALVVLTGGLEAPIAAHAVNNVFAFTYAALSGGVATARATQRIGPTQAAWDIGGFVVFGVCAVGVGRLMRVRTRAVVSGLALAEPVH